MILVWSLHHLVGILRPPAYQNAATLCSVFYKALCIEPLVSAIQLTTHLFVARAVRRLSTGTAVQACAHTIQSGVGIGRDGGVSAPFILMQFKPLSIL